MSSLVWGSIRWRPKYKRLSGQSIEHQRMCILILTYYPVNTRQWDNVVSMLAHRLRPWPNLEQTLGECLGSSHSLSQWWRLPHDFTHNYKLSGKHSREKWLTCTMTGSHASLTSLLEVLYRQSSIGTVYVGQMLDKRHISCWLTPNSQNTAIAVFNSFYQKLLLDQIAVIRNGMSV